MALTLSALPADEAQPLRRKGPVRSATARPPPPLCSLTSGGGADIPVRILVTGINSRRIGASTIIESSIERIWKVLTDYDRLADVVPNLVVSRRLANAPAGVVRVFQEGAQNIVGEQTGVPTPSTRRPLSHGTSLSLACSPCDGVRR